MARQAARRQRIEQYRWLAVCAGSGSSAGHPPALLAEAASCVYVFVSSKVHTMAEGPSPPSLTLTATELLELQQTSG